MLRIIIAFVLGGMIGFVTAIMMSISKESDVIE